MPVTIGTKENAFDNPVGVLTDCHRRIENFLQVLIKVAEDAHGGALGGQRREALEAALKYFRLAAPKHSADEEEDLFPALREKAEPRLADTIARLDRLEADHKNADSWHREVEELAEQWLRQDGLPGPHTARLQALLRSLSDLYRAHIEIEEREIFPLANAELSDAAKEAIGRRMASRRGVAFIPRK